MPNFRPRGPPTWAPARCTPGWREARSADDPAGQLPPSVGPRAMAPARSPRHTVSSTPWLGPRAVTFQKGAAGGGEDRSEAALKDFARVAGRIGEHRVARGGLDFETVEAKVKLTQYEGGHGWHGDIWSMMGDGIEWLDKQSAIENAKGKGDPSP